MNYRVKTDIKFLHPRHIEEVANNLLSQLEMEIGKPLSPPVNVEFLAEDVLGFSIQVEDLNESDALAYIDPSSMIISTNLTRSDYFDHAGYEFTWAHEIGHYALGHFEEVVEQLSFDDQLNPKKLIHRDDISEKDQFFRHEHQANQFAASLVIPKSLLYPEIANRNLCSWPTIYRLAELFCVTPTIMFRRLKDLGLIFKSNGKLYRNQQEAFGQLSLW